MRLGDASSLLVARAELRLRSLRGVAIMSTKFLVPLLEKGNAPRPVELRVVATASSSSYATFFSGATVAAAGRMAATSEGMFT